MHSRGAPAGFLLADVSLPSGERRSVLIDQFEGREARVSLDAPPQPGERLAFDLGGDGWVPALVRWTSGSQLGVEFDRDIAWDALMSPETDQPRS